MIKRIKVHTTSDDPGYRYPGNYGVEKFLELFSGNVPALLLVKKQQSTSWKPKQCLSSCKFRESPHFNRLVLLFFSPLFQQQTQRRITTRSVLRTCSPIGILKVARSDWPGRVI